jgi:hypothetical protein
LVRPGIFFFATVLGFVVDNVREIMENLKKGRTMVAENGHVLILGWTDRCPALLKELALACESEGGGTVVILAEANKVSLEAEMRNYLSKADLKNLHVVFRNGSAMVLQDLELVSAQKARVTIVLARTHGEADVADAEVLRIVLQLRALRGGLKGHVVAEMRDVDNEALVQMVGGGCVETVVSHDIIGRLMLMAARQPGLAVVYESLLGFEGEEFYLKEWPELVGVPFKELQFRFPNAIPLGMKYAEVEEGKPRIQLNPDNDLVRAGDEILVLARDDDSYTATSAPLPGVTRGGKRPEALQEDEEAEELLVCGWRRDVDDMIREMDLLLAKGSKLHMLNEVPEEERVNKLADGGLEMKDLRNIELVHHVGNSSVRRDMDALNSSAAVCNGLGLHLLNSVLLLADEQRETDMMHSDSHTLASLLLIRDIQYRNSCRGKNTKEASFLRTGSQRRMVAAGKQGVKQGTIGNTPVMRMSSRRGSAVALDARSFRSNDMKKCPVVCEVLDHRTQGTIQASPTLKNCSDYVQSNEFVSRVLAMVSERREVKCVLDDLFRSDGVRICIKPSSHYISLLESYSPGLAFLTVAERVLASGQVLIGYHSRSRDAIPILNPPDKEKLLDWREMDLLLLSTSRESSIAVAARKVMQRTKQTRLSHSPIAMAAAMGGPMGGKGFGVEGEGGGEYKAPSAVLPVLQKGRDDRVGASAEMRVNEYRQPHLSPQQQTEDGNHNSNGISNGSSLVSSVPPVPMGHVNSFGTGEHGATSPTISSEQHSAQLRQSLDALNGMGVELHRRHERELQRWEREAKRGRAQREQERQQLEARLAELQLHQRRQAVAGAGAGGW